MNRSRYATSAQGVPRERPLDYGDAPAAAAPIRSTPTGPSNLSRATPGRSISGQPLFTQNLSGMPPSPRKVPSNASHGHQNRLYQNNIAKGYGAPSPGLNSQSPGLSTGGMSTLSSFAVQSVAAPVNLKLKKAAVKIVRPACRAIAASSDVAMASTSNVETATKMMKENEPISALSGKEIESVKGFLKQRNESAVRQDSSHPQDLDTRLVSADTPVSLIPSGRTKVPAGPDKSFFKFEDDLAQGSIIPVAAECSAVADLTKAISRLTVSSVALKKQNGTDMSKDEQQRENDKCQSIKHDEKTRRLQENGGMRQGKLIDVEETKGAQAPDYEATRTGKAGNGQVATRTLDLLDQAGKSMDALLTNSHDEKTESMIDPSKRKSNGEELERHYLDKAFEYLMTLPSDGKTITLELLQRVASDLLSCFSPLEKHVTDASKVLFTDYIRAIVTYVNGLTKNADRNITSTAIKDVLLQTRGNLLYLCATLSQEAWLSVEDLEDVKGLCESLQKLHYEPTMPVVVNMSKVKDCLGAGIEQNMAVWPTQQKREHVPGSRTCILRGISETASVQQLQALVWGGRLESIAPPGPGSSCAVVRFLTAEGCRKYFQATENGITLRSEVTGGKERVVLVEVRPGPDSVNDVLQSCANSTASRCVRIYDADEDWGDMVLMKLARGSGKMTRDIDRIKRGTEPNQRTYIDFRFANIWHALNFKRVLSEDEEWEHCVIKFGPDPCEIATGVHFEESHKR